MLAKPLTPNCAQVLQRKDHVCLGISPFNSLFSEDYLQLLIGWARKEFESFHLFLPDEPTLFTLEALGYSEAEARRKMKKQINWLRNKMNRSLATFGLQEADHVLDWDRLTQSSTYQTLLAEVYEGFDGDEGFRRHCMGASQWVLQSKSGKTVVEEAALLKAVKYFLAEIPLFSATNTIVGARSSIFCYHQSIDFHHALYAQELAIIPHPDQGYGVLTR